MAALVHELTTTHSALAQLWTQREVRAACSPARNVHHAEAGDLGFDVQLLDVSGDLQLVVLGHRGPSRQPVELLAEERPRLHVLPAQPVTVAFVQIRRVGGTT